MKPLVLAIAGNAHFHRQAVASSEGPKKAAHLRSARISESHLRAIADDVIAHMRLAETCDKFGHVYMAASHRRTVAELANRA